MTLRLTNEQQVRVAVTPRTSHGREAALDGTPSWSSSNPAVATVVPDTAKPNEAVVIAQGLGSVQIVVSADADLSAGVRTISGVLDIEVVAAEAASLGVVAGTPGGPGRGAGGAGAGAHVGDRRAYRAGDRVRGRRRLGGMVLQAVITDVQANIGGADQSRPAGEGRSQDAACSTSSLAGLRAMWGDVRAPRQGAGQAPRQRDVLLDAVPWALDAQPRHPYLWKLRDRVRAGCGGGRSARRGVLRLEVLQGECSGWRDLVPEAGTGPRTPDHRSRARRTPSSSARSRPPQGREQAQQLPGEPGGHGPALTRQAPPIGEDRHRGDARAPEGGRAEAQAATVAVVVAR